MRPLPGFLCPAATAVSTFFPNLAYYIARHAHTPPRHTNQHTKK